MSPPEPAAAAPLKRLDGGPVFDEPWQAQALALADTLIGDGTIAAADWSAALGAALVAAQSEGAPDTVETYYRAVVVALEELTERHGGIGAEALAARREAWRQAYLTTPHGEPVVLGESSSRLLL